MPVEAPVSISTRTTPAVHRFWNGSRDSPPLTLKEVIHGSTVATNALLERKGARTALLTTEGFEDVIVIGRQTRRELYNIFVSRPEPLIPDELRIGIRERTLYDGSIERP